MPNPTNCEHQSLDGKECDKEAKWRANNQRIFCDKHRIPSDIPIVWVDHTNNEN